jgi:maltooligosyltrehalose trehalohydrolase
VSFRLRHGATIEPDGRVHFSVWAPRCERLDLRLLGARERTVPMVRREGGAPEDDGVFEADVAAGDAPAGTDYFFVLPGRGDRPDPTSRHQPQGPHGPSRIVDPRAFTWTDANWRGRDARDFITYELHVGTFTPQGTFDATIERLPHLVALGVTAVELMPVAEFPGTRNWGYDGVNLYAPQSSYGGPDGLKRLVDACHGHGLAVILDVVYNHLGPDGNYLGDFGPYFTRRYGTPWGDALNYDDADSEPVRRYFIDNALYWLTELHADALRLDAIHGIYDFGPRHILAEMKRAAEAESPAVGRPLALIAESDLNDPRVVEPREAGGYALDAQWSDDFHHAAFMLLTRGKGGFAPYLYDFGRLDDLRQAVADGFVYDGRHSRHRRRRHGRSSAAVPGDRLVIFLENHDQIANGARGERLGQLCSPGAGRAATALLFCAPNLPLLFMGQELAATTPFFYFTSHADPALGEAVSRGRRAEFAHFAQEGAEQEALAAWADPQSPETFARSRIDWSCLESAAHRAALAFHRDLIALRRRTPALSNGRKDLTRVRNGSESDRWLSVQRSDPNGSSVLLLVNLADEPRAVPIDDPRALRLALFTDAVAYGGAASPPPAELDQTTATVELPPESAAIYRDIVID